MANLNQIKKELKESLNKLPGDKKANIYFENMKKYIKLVLMGKFSQAERLLNKNNDFYLENQHQHFNEFHLEHHHFIEWYIDLQNYQKYQELLAGADREKTHLELDMLIIEALERLLKNYEIIGNKTSLKNAMKIIKTFQKSTFTNLKEINEAIPILERRIEKNKHFKRHDFFQDVDPIGYKNLSWRKYLEWQIMQEND